MRSALLAVPAAILLTAAAEPGTGSTTAPPAGLASCAEVADGAARLACYDRLAGRPAETLDAAASAAPAAEFGLKSRDEPQEPESLTAHLVGSLTEWRKGTIVQLDNGQRWKITSEDDGVDPRVPDGAAVTIRHRFLAYWMEIHATGRKLKVKRIS